MSSFMLALGFGIVSASILALAAVGFTLQFGVTNVFNLAYGQVMTVGMFAAYVVNVPAHGSIWLALAAGAVAGAIMTGLVNRAIFVPFIRRSASLGTVIFATLALGIIIENALLIIVGPGFFAYGRAQYSAVHIAGMLFNTQQLAIIGISVVALSALHLFLRYTRLGTAMRATAANGALARNCGVASDRVTMIAWLLSGALCGAGGVAFALNLAAFDDTTGTGLLLVVVAAAVIGGVGHVYGAMLGALVIGISTELAALASPDLKDVVAFGALALMLLIRPSGVLGTAATRVEAGGT